MAFREMVLHEIEWFVICGWPKEKTYLPASNNLGIRKRELQDELLNGIRRIQKEARERLARLAEDFRDEAAA